MEDIIEVESTNLCNSIKVTAWRKRTLTYWGNNNQYEKEEIGYTTSIELPVESEEQAKKKIEAIRDWLQVKCKESLDKQEKLMPKGAG